MIFEEDTVYVKDKGNTHLNSVQVSDEILSFDLRSMKDIWTKVGRIRKLGVRDMVYIIMKDAKHIRVGLEKKMLTTCENNFETVKSLAFGVSNKNEYFNVRTQSGQTSQIGLIKKFGPHAAYDLEVDNEDTNFFCNGICVKSA